MSIGSLQEIIEKKDRMLKLYNEGKDFISILKDDMIQSLDQYKGDKLDIKKFKDMVRNLKDDDTLGKQIFTLRSLFKGEEDHLDDNLTQFKNNMIVLATVNMARYGDKLTKIEEKTIGKMMKHLIIKNVCCNYCGIIINLKQCSKCKKVRYCGRDCQLKDWKDHKKDCL